MPANVDIDFTEIQKQIILGSILGDGALLCGKSIGSNARLAMTHGEKQLDYLKYKVLLLNDMITESGIRPTRGGYGTKCFVAQTKSYPYLTSLRKAIYIPGRPVVGKWIYDIDTLGLAIWYLDDGSGGKAKGRYISTHRYPYPEQLLLQEFLYKKFGVETEIRVDKRRTQYFLDLVKPSISPLFRLIKEHIPPSMMWKLPNKMIADRPCGICGKKFTPSPPNKMCCSEECIKLFVKHRRHPIIEKHCPLCGEIFEYKHLHEKYCDRCRTIARREAWQKGNQKRKVMA